MTLEVESGTSKAKIVVRNGVFSGLFALYVGVRGRTWSLLVPFSVKLKGFEFSIDLLSFKE